MAEDVVGVDRSRDLPEVVKCLSGVHCHQVTRDSVPESVSYSLECRFGSGECFEVTQVGDDELVTLVVGTVTFEKSLTQVVEASARRGAHRQGGDVVGASGSRGKVALVPDDHHVRMRGEVEGADSGLYVFLGVGVGVQKEQDRGGTGGLGQGTANAFGFHDVVCVPEAGCIDEPEPKAVDGAGVFYGVSGRAGNVRDNGPVVAK